MKFLRVTTTIICFGLLFAFVGCKKAEGVAKVEKPIKTTPAYSGVIGDRITITAASLPNPFDSDSATNPPKVVPAPANAKLNVPEGFEVSTFADGDLKNPRLLYELALAHARAGNKSKAINALSRAIENGFTDVAKIEENPEFESLRNESGFKKLVTGLKKS